MSYDKARYSIQVGHQNKSGVTQSLAVQIGKAVLITYLCLLIFLVVTTSEIGIDIIEKSFFIFIMGVAAPFSVIALASWHVIPAIALLIGSAYFVLKKLGGWKRLTLLTVMLLCWYFYGMMCVSIYMGA